jgi:hypothetical protein
MSDRQRVLSDRSQQVMAESDLSWRQAWQQAEAEIGGVPRQPPWRPRTSWVVIVSVVVLIAVVVISLLWLWASWREKKDLVFEESVSSVSQVLGTPDSPSADLDWHEGSSRRYSGRCKWTRTASWQLGNVDLADPIGRLESVVESVTGHSLRTLSGSGDDWTDLEGATSVFAGGIGSLPWLEAGVEVGERFRLSVYGGC